MVKKTEEDLQRGVLFRVAGEELPEGFVAAQGDSADAVVASETADAAAETTGDSAQSGEETPAAPAKPNPLAEIPDYASLTPQEQFRATTRLLFVAPDVPPVAPQQRRSEYQLQRGSAFLGRAERQLGREEESWERGSRREREGREEQLDLSKLDKKQLEKLLDVAFPQSAKDEDGSKRGRREKRGRDEDAKREKQEPQKVKGSTRLEAKKQRRRDNRDAGRKRLVITESEFMARREAVDREMIVRTTPDRVQIGVLEDRVLVEHYVARSSESSLIGNVYLGKVQNVLPSMEAAFVDIGRGRNAVLYSGEVDWSDFSGTNSQRRIENALKEGDEVLVQVTKDPVGHKGARLTSQISLPGRFLVYVPGGQVNGISRKLPDTERARLKKILKEILPEGAGVIVRTAAEGATEEQLTLDVQRLTRQWEDIKRRATQGGGPVLLHSEPDMLIKIIRDVFNEDFQKLVIAGEETFQTISNYLGQVAPDLLERVERYEGERDIFDKHRVNEQIKKALERKVWLPSGGSLVIDRTEAMTVVDVNTGKFVGSGGNLEETVTKNNLEAAEEIVRQLRLRDIGGIIVIDFIDMVLESNRDLVLRRLIECLSRDRTKHQVAEVTSLGLVQMTRKKLGLGLLESFSESCEVCGGRGLVIDMGSNHRHSHGGQQRSKRERAGSEKQQPHAITEGAKNMLAQVAASTIQAKEQPQDAAGAAADAVAESVAVTAGETAGAKTTAEDAQETGETPKRQRRSARAVASPLAAEGDSAEAPARSRRVRATAGSAFGQSGKGESAGEPDVAAALLGSVLDALPAPAPAGSRKSRSRRVQVPAQEPRAEQTVGKAAKLEQLSSVLDAALGEAQARHEGKLAAEEE